MNVCLRALVVALASLCLVVAPACGGGGGTGSGGEPDASTGGGGGGADASSDTSGGGTGGGGDATTGGGGNDTTGGGGGGDEDRPGGGGGGGDADTTGGGGDEDTAGGGGDEDTTGGGGDEDTAGGGGDEDTTGGGGDADTTGGGGTDPADTSTGGGGDDSSATAPDVDDPIEDAGPSDDGGPGDEDVPPPPLEDCEVVGQACDTGMPQSAPFICHGDGDVGFCTVSCETFEDGSSDCDPLDEYCTAAPGETGWCVHAPCTGTFFNSDCAPGTVCVPNQPGLDAPGTCFLIGDGEPGSECAAIEDCGPGTLCIGGTCLEMGCESLSGNVTCSDGLDCMTIISVTTGEAYDVGYCKDNCEPFAEDSGCAEGEACNAISVDNVTGVWNAECVEAGDGLAGQGQTCVEDSESPQTTCAPGFVCFEGACATLCDAYDTGTCGDGFSCAPWVGYDDDGNLVGSNDFGFCQEGCTPFADGGQCGDGEVCLPYQWGPGNGVCGPGGDVGPGGACDPDAEVSGCGEGLFCLTLGDDSTCVPFCDLSGKAGEAGDTCAADEGCRPFVHANPNGDTLPTELGYCHPSCEFHADIPCTDEALACYMDELVSADFDFCMTPATDPWPVDELATCPAGSEELDFCGPNSICLDNQFAGAGLRCYDICLSTTEPFGATNHDDCRRATAECVNAFGSDLLGLCGEDGGDLPPPNPECPTAWIQVQEGEEVIPQTKLHLVGSNSYGVNPISTYSWSVTQPAGSQSVFLPSSSAPDPTFETNVAGVYVFKLEVWDSEGKQSCVAAEYTVQVIPDEAIHVELLWHTPNDPDETSEGPEEGADLDLHFLHPYATGEDVDNDGQPDGWFDQPFDCFWFNSQPNWGSLDPFIDDDPGLDRDDTDGAGPENINLNIPEDGNTYKLGVHYWNDHGYGPSFATVRIYIFSQLMFEVETELVMGDLWEVATVGWSSGDINLITGADGGYKILPNYSHPFFPLPD